jgi:hypothetical protein
MGSILTNKYAEGYPGKRYYGGCECVDVVENLAIERAKELFGCDYANVQPHSGAQANMAVQFAVCKPGDTIMGMNLDHGGHLTHGSPVNMSGKYFHVVPYGVNDDGFLDYDKMRELAIANKPRLIIAGASASAFLPLIFLLSSFRAFLVNCIPCTVYGFFFWALSPFFSPHTHCYFSCWVFLTFLLSLYPKYFIYSVPKIFHLFGYFLHFSSVPNPIFSLGYTGWFLLLIPKMP